MKYIMILILCMQALVFLNGISGEFSSGSIVIEFPSSLNPKIQDGVVVTGNAAVDSLNTALGAVHYEYYDLSWTSRLKYVIVLHFDSSRVFDVEKEVNSYSQATSGLGARVEFIQNPEIESIPGEYLYSENIYHPEDTLWKLYSDGDDKRNWMINSRLQYQNSAGIWMHNSAVSDLYEVFWGPLNPVVVDEFLRPFPYHWAYHAHSSLWHHLDEYNNTYKAWDYSEGEQTLAICLDPDGYWTQHPDLMDRWLPGYPQYSNDGLTPPAGTTPSNYKEWYKYKYHGTNCVGAMAASKQSLTESELTNLSSVGVAPQTSVIGRDHSVFGCLTYLHNNPELQPVVLNASYLIDHSNTLQNAFEELIDMGVTIVKSRGYGDYPSTSCKYGNILEGFINVGDYRPDYRVKTKNNADSLNYYYEDYYKVEINAPGWDVWVPNVYHTYESGFTQVGYALAMGTNTSIAAPQVGGVVCLIKSLYPWMTPAEVERQIKLGAHHLHDLIDANVVFLPTTPHSFFGAGCLNAYGSLFLHGAFERDFTFSNEVNNTALIGRGFTLNNSTMTVENGILRLEKDARVIFNNSTLYIGDNVTVIFEQGSKLDMCPNSVLIVGNNVTFKTENGDSCQGIVLMGNNRNSVTFNNATFQKVPVTINNTQVDYNGCTFSKSNVRHNNESLSINYCDFDFCGIQVIQTLPDREEQCLVQNSSFNNSTETGIQITGYPRVIVLNNNIQYNYSGIELYECSKGEVTNNEISYNGNGILIYHSNVCVTGCNKITYNYRSSPAGDARGGNGIDARHLSRWKLIGQDAYPIQTIHNNQREQLLIEECSTPLEMYFNKVYGSNHSYPYVRIWTEGGRSYRLNIPYNNWSSDFVPERDFSPVNNFTYLPIWEPGIPRNVLEDEAKLIFNEALEAVDNEEYVMAEMKLKQVIEEYPDTDVCQDAMKELMILVEEFNQNYHALELYFETYPTLRDDPTLSKIADYLANFCKIKLGEYDEAIQYFENLILNPPTLPDSLYAVIDAGYAYLLMAQNSEKNSYTGKLAWLKPTSVFAYIDKRNELLNNKPINIIENNQDMPSIPTIITMNSYPNPFNPSTTIRYNLPITGNVKLEIYNVRGQLIKTLVNERMDSGEHTIEWNGTDNTSRSVSSGIYFSRLTSGNKTAYSKMLLMK